MTLCRVGMVLYIDFISILGSIDITCKGCRVLVVSRDRSAHTDLSRFMLIFGGYCIFLKHKSNMMIRKWNLF